MRQAQIDVVFTEIAVEFYQFYNWTNGSDFDFKCTTCGTLFAFMSASYSMLRATGVPGWTWEAFSRVSAMRSITAHSEFCNSVSLSSIDKNMQDTTYLLSYRMVVPAHKYFVGLPLLVIDSAGISCPILHGLRSLQCHYVLLVCATARQLCHVLSFHFSGALK